MSKMTTALHLLLLAGMDFAISVLEMNFRLYMLMLFSVWRDSFRCPDCHSPSLGPPVTAAYPDSFARVSMWDWSF